MRRSKVLLLEDAWFSYSFTAFLLGIHKSGGTTIVDYTQYMILSFALLAFLAYVEPIDNFLIFPYIIFQDKRLSDQPNSQFLLRSAFESSYLDYTRFRLRSALYLVVLLAAITVQYNTTVRIIAIITSIAILFRFIKDLRELPMKVYAVAGYIGAISSAGKIHSKVEVYLNYAKQALESGNWVEAFKWLAISGISGDVRIPKQILERVWQFK
jgi:hypothetical protein